MKKTAVVLFNLGGPDSLEAVQPFLFNLFHDPAIIRLPQPLRYLIAKLISGKRAPVAQEIYKKIGGRSPILPNTEAQAAALEQKLGGDFRCFIAMSYWHPLIEDTARHVKEYNPHNIILLPLYPQFSTTTTASSLKAWHKVAAKAGIAAPTKTICCYPAETGFIGAIVASTRMAIEEAKKYGAPRVLFSAHGLPEKIVKAGDPYAWQCQQTAAALAKELALESRDWTLCYQSRVGPMTWIGPSTDNEVRRAGHDRVPVVMVPIAFVSEHSETLVELDIEYRAMATTSGVPFYALVPTVGTQTGFIEGLAGLLHHAAASPGTIISAPCVSHDGGRLCPSSFAGCPHTF